MSSEARSWFETMAWIGGDPGRAAALIALAQFGDEPQPELTLATSSGLIHQQLTGQPVETAAMLKHVFDLGARGLFERDASGFKWQLTSLGRLVSRQWISPRVEPDAQGPLSIDEVRGWRDLLCAALDDDARLADEAGLGGEELLAFQGGRLTELNVLNRVLGEQRLPEWMAAFEELDDEADA